MKVFLKYAYLPLAILAVTAAGSIFAEVNNFLLFESKYNFSASVVNWFSFAVNASVLFGIFPSYLYRKYGPRKTIILGGLLLTAAHLAAALMLNTKRADSVATVGLFVIGVVGGQGASIIFITTLSYMLRYHSIVCTNLLCGLLFSYFLGSDTFHIALKYGVFSELTLSSFLVVIACFGLLTYIVAAYLFTMKSKHADQETSSSKGVLLKRSVQLYVLIQAAYLGLSFMLIITYALYTKLGSQLLCLILGINVLVPIFAISFLSTKALKKQVGHPSETDKFLMHKGGNASLGDAKHRKEFWLILLSFSITIGISRMMNDNAAIIALNNSSNSQNYQRAFQVFETLGCFGTGVFLNFFRLWVSPYALFAFYTLLLVASQVLMFFIQISNLASLLAIIIVGFASGGCFCLIGVISHEDYGTKWVSKILGYLMTGAAFGILVFDEILFDILYRAFASQADYQAQKSYGKWNFYIFLVCLLSSIAALMMSVGAYLSTRKHDGNKDRVADFINM